MFYDSLTFSFIVALACLLLISYKYIPGRGNSWLAAQEGEKILIKFKIYMPFVPAIPILGLSPTEILTKSIHTQGCSLYHCNKQFTWKYGKCPSIKEWISKSWPGNMLSDSYEYHLGKISV